MLNPFKLPTLFADDSFLIARKQENYILISASPKDESDSERQQSIINALVFDDPFPEASADGRERIWLKIGQGKKDADGGENVGLLEALVEAEIIAPTGTVNSNYPLVELLVDDSGIANACLGCRRFESTLNDTRFKRCSRCKQAYYCSGECQSSHWKSHKPTCFEILSDDAKTIQNARRNTLLRLYGRIVQTPQLAPKDD